MSSFTYGSFCYIETSNDSCTLGCNSSAYANAPINGVNFSGIATIPPSVVYNARNYTVNKVGKHAFRGCRNMTGVNLPNTIVVLGWDGFFGTKIRSLFIPASVEILEYSAFSNMNHLESITFQAGSKLRILNNAAMASAPKLRSVILPPNIITFGDHVFAYDYSLRYIFICGNQDLSDVKRPFYNILTPVTVYVTSDYPATNFSGINVTVSKNRCVISLPYKKSCIYRERNTFNIAFSSVFLLISNI